MKELMNLSFILLLLGTFLSASTLEATNSTIMNTKNLNVTEVSSETRLTKANAAAAAAPSLEGVDLKDEERKKRGYGHGGGGGGGGGGHGHGKGRGGGASGPIYFCGYIGSKEGYGGYGK